MVERGKLSNNMQNIIVSSKYESGVYHINFLAIPLLALVYVIHKLYQGYCDTKVLV